MLLWGVPIPLDRDRNPIGWELRRSLEIISIRLGEDPASMTEPDVLIDFGAHGRFITEVKHRGGTSLQDVRYAGWNRYFPANSPLPYATAMRSSECYELARNWKFGLELDTKTDRPFTLGYLGSDTLFEGDRRKSAPKVPRVACRQRGRHAFRGSVGTRCLEQSPILRPPRRPAAASMTRYAAPHCARHYFVLGRRGYSVEEGVL